MKDDLLPHIRHAYSMAEAQRYADFADEKRCLDEVVSIGKEVLEHVPPCAGACAIMSALWTALVRDRLDLPVYCVAGDLLADGRLVFGHGASSTEFAVAFGESNLDWDGHCWLVLGEYIGDLSVFRTAYAATSPRPLRDLVLSRFGLGRGLWLATEAVSVANGLSYKPRYVLTNQQLDGLVLGGRALFDSGGAV